MLILKLFRAFLNVSLSSLWFAKQYKTYVFETLSHLTDILWSYKQGHPYKQMYFVFFFSLAIKFKNTIKLEKLNYKRRYTQPHASTLHWTLTKEISINSEPISGPGSSSPCWHNCLFHQYPSCNFYDKELYLFLTIANSLIFFFIFWIIDLLVNSHISS